MLKQKGRSQPRGALNESGGLLRGGKIKKVLLFIICGGILLSGILGQSLKAAAAESDGIPEEIKEICERVGAEFDICPELLEAICYHESRFDPKVKNKNHYGLMQINVKIHKDRIEKYEYTAADMFEAEPNIRVGADLLAELFNLFGDDDYLVLSFYAGGWKAVENYKEYGFLLDYVTEILERSAYYERLHGK